MIGLGTTLRCNLPPRHIWIVLSDPAQTSDRILLVNLTTLTDDCVDDVCILEPSDYPLLTQATTLAYSRAKAGTACKLEELVAAGDFSMITKVPTTVLAKALLGAHESRQLSASQKQLLAPAPS